MNKSIWLLLPFNSDWRWMLNRKGPWYPNMTIFQQLKLTLFRYGALRRNE